MSKRKKRSYRRLPPDQPIIAPKPAVPHLIPAGMVLIAILACFAYFPSINGGFIIDDDRLLTGNSLIKAHDGLYKFWFTTEPVDYWPMTNTLFWIQWRLWGMNPTGYHLVNLILHVCAAILIWFILRKLSIPGAWMAAAIFAVHPVNVESVAWISQLKNTLCMFFFLLSVLCYLQAETQPKPSKYGPMPRTVDYWYYSSLLLCILAMLSKGSAVILPVMLLGTIWWRRGSLTIWDLVGMAPFFVAAIGFALVNIWFQTHGSGQTFRHAVFIERLLGAGGVLWFYLYKAILPVNLIFIYPQWHVEAGNPLWWLPLPAALAFTALLWWFRKGWGRPLLFAWGFFCVALAPVMGFFDAGFMQFSLVADHYQHIAIIGVIALVSAGIALWGQRAKGGMLRTTMVVIIAGLAR